jgi:adenylate cyclase
MDPEKLVTLLNRYFALITAACDLNRGTVDKYTGDGVMLVFGAPEEDADHAFHAASCALLMRQVIAHENRRRQTANLNPIHFRIGINAGSMLAGNLGSKEKMEYTVVGDTVNLASRFCSMAKADQIVVSRDFYDLEDIALQVIAHEHLAMQLRGIAGPVATFLLEDLAPEFRGRLEEQLQTIIGESDDDHAPPQ